MNKEPVAIRRALISVSDKTGVEELALFLHAKGVKIISTGGTAALLTAAGIPVIGIASITEFPEMMDGRVKTLHPRVHGALLGLRDVPDHVEAARKTGIQWIDLVICNLYPFAKTIEKSGVSLDEAIEQIDIGGPSMIRSAAKNVGWVTVATCPDDYPSIMDELETIGNITYNTRKRLCAAAFRHTAAYDALIQDYLTEEKFPSTLTYSYRKISNLRYGENPHQEAAVYESILPPTKREALSALHSTILGGKELSYNNINDADGALLTLREFHGPACVVVKHANPCGASTGIDLLACVEKAYEADSLSAFGGIVAMNRTCTVAIAQFLQSKFIEIVIAPDYEPEALALLKRKKALRILQTGEIKPLNSMLTTKTVAGGLLVQDRDVSVITKPSLQVVTKQQPSATQIDDMLFAWKVLKHVKSNAILIAHDQTTVGIGPGQVSRVDAVKIALRKSSSTQDTILASDAFFPFRDSIDALAETGIKAIIQPGGSVRDQEVIDACDEHAIAMVFTGVRCFYH
jgi:phosphoribosylaminoimidazolecarboxamide formyltransferase / IMP cyclohydrolase